MTIYFIDVIFFFCSTLFQAKEVDQSVVIIQMERGLRFPAVSELQNLLDDKALIQEKPPSAILDFSNVSSMDYSVVEVLKRKHHIHHKDIKHMIYQMDSQNLYITCINFFSSKCL